MLIATNDSYKPASTHSRLEVPFAPEIKSKPIIRGEHEIMKMAEAGRYNALFFSELEKIIQPGVSTMDLEDFANEFCASHGIVPAFKQVPGYQWALCTSVNEVAAHGIPSKDVILQDGDIVSVDFGVMLDGYIGDSTVTYMVGNVSNETSRLCAVAKEALNKAIEVIRPGATIGDIGYAINSYVTSQGFSVAIEHAGHGVGQELHEAPSIPHRGFPGKGMVLQAGMVIAVEPIVNEGSWKINVLNNGLTTITNDNKLSAQYEHTIAVVPGGCIVLTE